MCSFKEKNTLEGEGLDVLSKDGRDGEEP